MRSVDKAQLASVPKELASELFRRQDKSVENQCFSLHDWILTIIAIAIKEAVSSSQSSEQLHVVFSSASLCLPREFMSWRKQKKRQDYATTSNQSGAIKWRCSSITIMCICTKSVETCINLFGKTFDAPQFLPCLAG